MLKVLVLLGSLLGFTNAYANIDSASQFEFNNRLNSGTAFKHSLGDRMGRILAVYDVSAKDNGSSTVNSGIHGLGAFLPANAVIVRSFLHVKTALDYTSAEAANVSAGESTLAFQCEDSANIKAATDLNGQVAGTFIDGESDDTLANFDGNISARCEISAVVGGFDVDAGKINVFVDYVISP